jgi:hypothetical protein
MLLCTIQLACILPLMLETKIHSHTARMRVHVHTHTHTHTRAREEKIAILHILFFIFLKTAGKTKF